jgi:hypothetical protein
MTPGMCVMVLVLAVTVAGFPFDFPPTWSPDDTGPGLGPRG